METRITKMSEKNPHLYIVDEVTYVSDAFKVKLNNVDVENYNILKNNSCVEICVNSSTNVEKIKEEFEKEIEIGWVNLKVDNDV